MKVNDFKQTSVEIVKLCGEFIEERLDFKPRDLNDRLQKIKDLNAVIQIAVTNYNVVKGYEQLERQVKAEESLESGEKPPNKEVLVN